MSLSESDLKDSHCRHERCLWKVIDDRYCERMSEELYVYIGHLPLHDIGRLKESSSSGLLNNISNA